MENTEYCSFVSSHYIICECGDNFPSEEELRRHIATDHDEKKEDAPSYSNPPIRTIYVITNKDIKEEATESVVNEIQIPDEEEVYYEPDIDSDEYSRPPTEAIEECEVVTEDGSYCTEEVLGNLEMEIKEEADDGLVTTTANENGTGEIICTEVVFKKERLKQVILGQANEEHSYIKSTPNAVKTDFFYCGVCGKTFKTERSVKMHMARVHGFSAPPRHPHRKRPATRASVCDVCGRTYTSAAALRYHGRVHTGEKPYKCTMCPKAFTMPLFLQVHIRTHTGEKPHECTECPKAFGNRAALLRHLRVHTGEKPYECPECLKCFSQSNSMKLHVQTVHLKLPTPYKSKARRMRASIGKIRKGTQKSEYEFDNTGSLTMKIFEDASASQPGSSPEYFGQIENRGSKQQMSYGKSPFVGLKDYCIKHKTKTFPQLKSGVVLEDFCFKRKEKTPEDIYEEMPESVDGSQFEVEDVYEDDSEGEDYEYETALLPQ